MDEQEVMKMGNSYALEKRVGEKVTIIRGYPPHEETTTGKLVVVNEAEIVVKTDKGTDVYIKRDDWSQIKFRPSENSPRKE